METEGPKEGGREEGSNGEEKEGKRSGQSTGHSYTRICGYTIVHLQDAARRGGRVEWVEGRKTSSGWLVV